MFESAIALMFAIIVMGAMRCGMFESAIALMFCLLVMGAIKRPR